MTPEPVVVPDITGAYAAQVREHLAAEPGRALIVPELCAALQLSDRIVRSAVDRLVFTRQVTVTYRHIPHRRGSMPRQYHVANQS